MIGQGSPFGRLHAAAAILLWVWVLAVFAVYIQNYAEPIKLMFGALFG
jgi:hypothetical protein